MFFRRGPGSYLRTKGPYGKCRMPEVSLMAICKRIHKCAALTNKDLIDAIEKEQTITEKMVVAILWGL